MRDITARSQPCGGFGVESSVRPSLAVYNNRADIDALITTLKRLQSRWMH